MSTYYPNQKNIKPYHARQPLPLYDAKGWIRTALPGHSFIIMDGQVSDLPTQYQLWLEVWEDEGFITYETIEDYEIATRRNPRGYRVRVTKTKKKL